jgi:hypothetical protein
MNKYEVPVIYRGMENHIVEAENEAEAVRKTRELFGTAAKPVILGNEWEEIITINTPRLVDRPEPTAKTAAPAKYDWIQYNSPSQHTVFTGPPLASLVDAKNSFIAQLPSRSPRDWTEDFPEENGCYENHCTQCQQKFYGYKRRVICRVCSHPTTTV